MIHVSDYGCVRVWTLDRPAVHNALNTGTLQALAHAAAEAKDDPSIRAAVLTGAGRYFSAGGDLRELHAVRTAEAAGAFSDAGFAVTRAFEALPFPVICALDGSALGGGAELALACDMRIASPSASLTFKHARMGVTPAWGTTARLAAIAGASTAARVLMTGQEISAEQAFRMHLIDAVAGDGPNEPDDLAGLVPIARSTPNSETSVYSVHASEQRIALRTAIRWGYDIAQGSPNAIASMKRLLARGPQSPLPGDSHESARANERASFVAAWLHADHAEALDAFAHRREPRRSPRAPKT